MLAYGILSTPYIHSSIALGCVDCTLSNIALMNPVRSISMLGLAWIPHEGRSGSPSFYLFLHLMGLVLCSMSLRAATSKRSNGEKEQEEEEEEEDEADDYTAYNREDSTRYYAMEGKEDGGGEGESKYTPPTTGVSPRPHQDKDTTDTTQDTQDIVDIKEETFKSRCTDGLSWAWYIYLLLEAYAFIISLVVLYVCGLLWVDIIHAVYMIFFILFVVVPSSRKYWRLLVVFTGVVLLTMYVWNIAETSGTTLDADHWSKEIGIDANITSPDIPGQLLYGGTHSFFATGTCH